MTGIAGGTWIIDVRKGGGDATQKERNILLDAQFNRAYI
jgi:hypothetical protein